MLRPLAAGVAAEKGVDIDRAVQRLQPGGNLTHALHAREPLHLEKAIELLIVGGEEVAQDVDVAPGVDGSHLDAGDDAYAVRRGRLARLGHAGHRVVVGHAHHAQSGLRRERDERRGPQPAVGRGGVQMEIDPEISHGASGAGALPGLPLGLGAALLFLAFDEHALAFDEQAILANEEVEVRPLLVGELEEDPLAFGILEPLAVPLEEPVRSALAADADQQRLLVVDPCAANCSTPAANRPLDAPLKNRNVGCDSSGGSAAVSSR